MNSIRMSMVQASVDAAQRLSEFAVESLFGDVNMAEEKEKAMSMVWTQFAIAHAAAAASIWSGSGSWQEKLIESIGVSAALFTDQAIAMANIAKAATGADFTTSGPQLLMVGDNPGGRERVQVTPIGSPNVNGPQGSASSSSTMNLNIYDAVTGDRLVRMLRNGELSSFVPDLKRALVTA